MSLKKTVGQNNLLVDGNVELLTKEICGIEEGTFYLDAFFLTNKSTEDIGVSINDGGFITISPEETLNFSKLTKVGSCKLDRAATIRWGGLI